MRRPSFAVLVASLLAVVGLVVPMQVRLLAAITVTEKMTGGFGAGAGSTTNSTGYTTSDTFSIASGAIGLCFLQSSDADTAEDYASVMRGSAFTKIDTQLFTASSLGRVSAWWVAGPIADGPLSMSVVGGADAQTGYMAICYEVAGVNTATPILQSKIGNDTTQTNHTLTMTNARTANSALFFFAGAQAALTWTAEYAGVGTEAAYATPTVEGRVQWDIGGADITPNWATASATTGMIAVEIDIAGAAASNCSRSLLGVGCTP
jgi:hypothetical protein